ncbi:trimeric intracellular cation channel type B isoform X1 [Pimephales promelas]|uniref:trimeric intracellular cation channel type B isoform X1 n=1 Tax=Pimephales promelas TaxID=90988 RepID=UPI001955B1BC|nr:trimeric intracellular cation channel type B isoform X1 [Pimephales promelas]XP_039519901.1 trimeric intracellular cation channel type B isoform X1 [Pimephales promelas]
MDVFEILNLNELALGLSNLSMFPYFDMAHYIISVMSLREQPGVSLSVSRHTGVLTVSQLSPLACWFSSMLYCFGGAVLSALMMADAPVAPLSNTTNLLIASLMWYLVFYCPLDAVYSLASVWPIRLVLTGMKEVTRTWKVVGGVTQAGRKYKDGLFVMIAVGWAKGAGGGLISNFEQLVRGIWKPETNELLKMSYPTKVTLLGSVLFSLQQCRFLPMQTHHLIFIYTIFIVTNKMRMMIMGSSSYPFSSLESVLYKTLFVRPLTFSPLIDSTQGSDQTLKNSSISEQKSNNTDQRNPEEAKNAKKKD